MQFYFVFINRKDYKIFIIILYIIILFIASQIYKRKIKEINVKIKKRIEIKKIETIIIHNTIYNTKKRCDKIKWWYNWTQYYKKNKSKKLLYWRHKYI